ncbi:MAG: hypothetical protein BWY83_00898 [bacterium ADurb.Bin478]|nr:MAG: hypothetical protein BWY83_00898 [bacterium ADurb.Bin478]
MQVGKFRLWRGQSLRYPAAIRTAGGCFVFFERFHLQNIDAVAEPGFRRLPDLFHAGLLHGLEYALIERRVAGINLIAGQDIGFAAKAADAFDAADKAGEVLRFNPFQFFGVRAFLQERGQFLIQGLFDPAQLHTGLG